MKTVILNQILCCKAPLSLPALAPHQNKPTRSPIAELELKLPKRQRDSTLSAEVTELIELAAHKAVWAVWSDYWLHGTFIPEGGRISLSLSTGLAVS